MEFYETFFILNAAPDVTDAQIQKVADLISSNKGEVVSIDRWGMRKLAYEIKRTSQGYYTCIYFKGDESLPRILENHYKLNEMCLRYLTVVSIHTPEEIAARTEKAAVESRIMGMEPTEEADQKPFEKGREGVPEEPSDEHLDTTDQAVETLEEEKEILPDEEEKTLELNSDKLEEEDENWEDKKN